MSMNQSFDQPRPLEPDYGRRMTHAEAVILCRYAKATCPQQAFDEYTPDAWSDLLGDLRFEDCKQALREVVKRKPFVAPAEIRDEVKRIRSRRVGEFGPLPAPPDSLAPGEHRDWHVGMIRAIGDGELTRENYQPPEVAPPATPEQIAAIRALAGRRMDDA